MADQTILQIKAESQHHSIGYIGNSPKSQKIPWLIWLTGFVVTANLIAVSISSSAYGQKNIRQYVESSLSVITTLDSIQIGKGIGAIKSAIGDAKVVMLGEQSHGDGTTFFAKSQLVKYLHDSLGFDVLVFESDFFALTNGWPKVQKDAKAISSFLKYNVYPVWSFSDECKELLYHFIPATYQTERPLKIAGIDSQMHGKYTADSLPTCLNRFFEIHKNALPDYKRYQAECTSLLSSVLILNYKNEKYLDSILNTNFKQRMVSLSATFNEICETIPRQYRSQDEYLALKNIMVFINDITQRKNKAVKESRDAQMAENLKWLVQSKFQSSKIIVWAANTHIMRNALTSFQKPSSNMETLGTAFTGDPQFSDKTYILGFTSSTGESQTVMQRTPFQIKYASNGFESWIADTVHFGFVDFRKFNSIQQDYNDYFILKARGHSPIMAKWTNVFDGVFYIRRMYSTHPIKF
jgi:erythromycin esterase-like protein